MLAVADPSYTMGDILSIVFSQDFVSPRGRSQKRRLDRAEDAEKINRVQPAKIPTITVSDRTELEYIDAQIVMSPLPTISAAELNHCAIERILNHVKDAFVKGSYDDKELGKWLDGREFCFCLTYVFIHDRNNRLNINFYVSHTETAPAWKPAGLPTPDATATKNTKSRKNNGPKDDPIPMTPMSADEIEVVKDAFLRQCVRALNNYVTLVYDYSQRHNLEPDYYRTGLPGTL